MYKTFVSNDVMLPLKETHIALLSDSNLKFEGRSKIPFNIFQKKERVSSVDSNDIFDIDFLDNALDQFSKNKKTPISKIRKVASDSDYFKIR